MSSKGYGFSKPASPASSPNDAHRKLDFADLDAIAPLEVNPDKEDKAIKAGEALGFRAREPHVPASTGPYLDKRAVTRVPQGKILVTGPAEIIAQFVEFSRSRGHKAYWNTIAELMERKRSD